MASAFDAKTNKPVRVAESDVLKKLRAGEIYFTGNVDLVDKDGGIRSFDPASEQFATAITKYGDKFLDEKDQERMAKIRDAQSFTGGLKAAAQGYASGATFGASDVAAGALGEAEDFKIRQEFSPIAYNLGLLGSVFSPGGGAGLIAKGAAKVAPKAAAAVAGKVSPAVAKAVMGGAGGAARKAGVAAAAKLPEMLAQRGVIASGGKAARLIGAGAQQAVEGALFQTGREISDTGLGKEFEAEAALSSIGLASAISAGFGVGFEAAGMGASAIKSKFSSNMSRLISQADDGTSSLLSKADEKRARAFGFTPDTYNSIKGSAKTKTKTLIKALDTLEDVQKSGVEIVGKYANTRDTARRVINLIDNTDKALIDTYGIAAGRFRGNIDAAEKRKLFQKEMFDAFSQKNGAKDLLKEAAGIADDMFYVQNAAGQNVLRKNMTLQDLLNTRAYLRAKMGTRAAETSKRNPALAAYTKAERWIDSQIQPHMKNLLGKEEFEAFKVNQKIYKNTLPIREAMAKRIMRSDIKPQTMAGESLAGLSAIGGAAFGGPVGAAVGFFAPRAAKAALREAAERFPSYEYSRLLAAKSTISSEALRVSAALSSMASKTADAMLGATPFVSSKIEKAMSPADIARIQTSLASGQAAQALAAHIDEEVPDDDNTATALKNKLKTALDELDNNLPKPPKGYMPSPILNRKWSPSTIEAMRFSRVANAIANPTEEMERIANGDFNAASWKALRAVYPDIAARYLAKVTEKITKSGKPLSSQGRRYLAVLLSSIDPSMEPAFIRKMQQVAGSQPAQEVQLKQQKKLRMTQASLQSLDEAMGDVASPLDSIASNELIK